MKSYPSIKRATGNSFREIKLYTFDKIDGSNLRFEWSKKRGWYKFGIRKRLFDETDITFGEAIPLFMETLADPLCSIAKKARWESVVVFCEFWGEKSFAGLHEPKDNKKLTVIDVAPYKQGILPPKEFLNLFGEYGPKYFGIINWTRGFVKEVRNGNLDTTFEGVVGKNIDGNKIVMYKAKTQKWIDAVLQLYGQEEGKKIIES